MGQRGPRAIPAEIHKLEGTYRAHRHEAGCAVDILPQIPPPPETLGEVGREAWIRKGADLQQLNLLEVRYLDCLERYCIACDQFAIAKAAVEVGPRYITTDKGFIVAHPALKDMKDWDGIAKRYLVEMGQTPSSASGVASKPQKASVLTRKRA